MGRPDPLGRAMLDYARGDYERGACEYVTAEADAPRNDAEHANGEGVGGERRERARVFENYFDGPNPASEDVPARLSRLANAGGRVLDVGCGAGQHARWLQERVTTLAADASPNAVCAAREMGVVHAAEMDLFDLAVPADAFRGVHCIGTQATLNRPGTTFTDVLDEFARVTDDAGVAFVDAFDPEHADADRLFGYRDDPRDGLASRAFRVEYDGEVGRTLAFTLYAPDRFRDAAAGTEWRVADAEPAADTPHYVVELRKQLRGDND
ncbi:class I SAM-dependent methyltransferase [Halocalculus aciditolerans]|uniref:Methyltransferase domain-containing protein n=1 Tax=Halocalculus aciditolerans TaxID=1383812 RepID=A0A830FGR6_9EURY|nr:class I SAM-dependent methyltransferase [Halocalculus aciditolerans]GGL54210.1 hypothetical protein GCM10009039_10470 [Halocalculus aciditolerans]